MRRCALIGEASKTYVKAKICGDTMDNFYVFAKESYNPLKGVFYKEILAGTKMETGKISRTVHNNIESGLLSFKDSLLIYDIRYVSYEQIVTSLKMMNDEYIQFYNEHINYMKQISNTSCKQVSEGKKFIKNLKKNKII